VFYLAEILFYVLDETIIEECITDAATTVIYCKEKSTVLIDEMTSTDSGQMPADEVDATTVDVIASCLLQDQSKTVLHFSAVGQQQSEDCEVVDTDSNLFFCTCLADVSEVHVDFMQTFTGRVCANSMELPAPGLEEETPNSELTSVPESESAPESEILYEFSVAGCNQKPESSTLEDVCTFVEGSTSPEIPELVMEDVEEPSEISMCLETAELRDKSATHSSEELLETAEELVCDDVEDLPANEQVESSEVSSETVEAELKQKIASEADVQSWSLEADDIDDFFEMAYDGKLSAEEVLSETVVLENKSQPISSFSNLLIPDIFDGLFEDILALETEDVTSPSEIPSDTVLLELKRLESSYTSRQELSVIDEQDQVKETAHEFEEVTVSPDEILSDTTLLELKKLENSYTTDQELIVVDEGDQLKEMIEEFEEVAMSPDEIVSDTVVLEFKGLVVNSYTSDQILSVIDEEDHVKEMAEEFEEVTVSPDEISLEIVDAEAAGLKTVNTVQSESPSEEQPSTEIFSELETMVAGCDEIVSEFIEPSNTMVSLPGSQIDGVIEVNELDLCTDIAEVDEDKVVEPEEIRTSLASTSVLSKMENLTTELVDESSFDGIVDGEFGVEAEELPEGTTLDSPCVSDGTVRVQMQTYSSEQTSVQQEETLGDNIDELRVDSVEGEKLEDLAAEVGHVTGFPQSCAEVMKEELMVEEFNDLPDDDITLTSFVSEATKDANSGTDSPATVHVLITTMSSPEFESASYLTKTHQRTPERQLTVNEEDTCREVEELTTVAEPVVGEVSVDLETATAAPELELYEIYTEEEVITEEKITESILTTVASGKPATVQDEDVIVEGTKSCTVCAWCVWSAACFSSHCCLL